MEWSPNFFTFHQISCSTFSAFVKCKLNLFLHFQNENFARAIEFCVQIRSKCAVLPTECEFCTLMRTFYALTKHKHTLTHKHVQIQETIHRISNVGSWVKIRLHCVEIPSQGKFCDPQVFESLWQFHHEMRCTIWLAVAERHTLWQMQVFLVDL